MAETIKKQNIILDSGYIVKKSDLTDKQIKKIKQDLTISPTSNIFTEDITPYKIYTTSKNYICLPRYYGNSLYGLGKYKKKKKNFHNPKINFLKTLRDYQIEIVNTCIEYTLAYGGGIISIPCGYGKTVCGLYIFCKICELLKRNLKLLVVVHKSDLVDQWTERIEEYTDAKIGKIQGPIIDVENKNIVIGMVQSISMKTYDKNIFSSFDYVIYDECHHCPAKVFSKALSKTAFEFTMGLSATPVRSDGLMKVALWNLGPIMYLIDDRKDDTDVDVKIFNYTSTDKLFCEKKKWCKGQMVASHPVMLTNITNIADRNTLIVNILLSIYKNSFRKTIILSHRVDHLILLKKNVDNHIKILNDENTNSTGLYIGTMKKNELKKSAEASMLFATFKMAEEALDIKTLNTLVFATPIKFVKQSVGRILRELPKDRKIVPLVIDIADNLSIFNKWIDIRRDFYIESQYNLIYHEVKNKNLIKLDDYLKNNNIVDKKNKNVDKDILYLQDKFGRIGKSKKIKQSFEKETDIDLIFSEKIKRILPQEKITDFTKEFKLAFSDSPTDVII